MEKHFLWESAKLNQSAPVWPEGEVLGRGLACPRVAGAVPSAVNRLVRCSGSQRMVIDGPFAGTKELLAGYAILQFASKAEAIEWTKRFVQVDAPGRLNAESECELRPFFEFDDFDPSEAVERFRRMGMGAGK